LIFHGNWGSVNRLIDHGFIHSRREDIEIKMVRRFEFRRIYPMELWARRRLLFLPQIPCKRVYAVMQFHAVKSADETNPLIVFVQSYEARSNMSLNIEFRNPNQGKNQVYVRKLVKSIRNYYLSVLIGIGVCLNQLKIGCVVWFIEFRNWDEKDPFIELGGNMYDFWKPVLAFFKTNLSNRFISKDGLPNIFFPSHLIDFSNSLNSAKCSQWFAFEFKLNLKLGPSLKHKFIQSVLFCCCCVLL